MRRSAAALLSMVVAASACSSSDGPPIAPTASARVLRVASSPPSAKDVIDVVLASAHVPLSVSPTCQGAGTEASDATIGRYLAGFLAEMSAPGGGNAIETAVEPGKLPGGEPAWQCRLALRHAEGDDVWRWGVQFMVRQSDGQVVEESFQCVGAG